MITGTVLVGIALILSLMAFMSKRRFGTLALAMAAGYVISNTEAVTVADWISSQGVSLGVIAVVTVVSMAIILLPSILLFFGGPTYSNKRQRITGAILYGVAALLFCLGALEHSLVLAGQEKLIFSYIWHYRDQAIVLLLVLAIIDMFLVHAVRGRKAADA